MKYRSLSQPHIYFTKVDLWVTLIHYPKYNISPSNSCQVVKQNHQTMNYRSCWLIFTLRSKFGSHCLIICKYDTHASNSLGDIRQNHWTMKYMDHTDLHFFFRLNVGSYRLIIPNNDVHIGSTDWNRFLAIRRPISLNIEFSEIQWQIANRCSICLPKRPKRTFTIKFSQNPNFLDMGLCIKPLHSLEVLIIKCRCYVKHHT